MKTLGTGLSYNFPVSCNTIFTSFLVQVGSFALCLCFVGGNVKRGMAGNVGEGTSELCLCVQSFYFWSTETDQPKRCLDGSAPACFAPEASWVEKTKPGLLASPKMGFPGTFIESLGVLF